MRKVLSFFFIIFSFDNLFADFFHITLQHDRQAFVYCNDSVEKNMWEAFDEAVFKIPKLLDQACALNIPIVIIVPEYTGQSPLDKDSAHIEGARVALAWASAYFRFQELGNVDVKVITYPKNAAPTLAEITSAVNYLLSKKDKGIVCQTPEQAMEARIVKLEDLCSEKQAVDAQWQALDLKSFQADSKICFPINLSQTENKKRVLITGGAGFIGSFLTKQLLAEGYQVIVLDNFLCCDKTNLLECKDNPDLVIIEHDVTKAFTVEGPVDYVMHLASLPSPAFYYTKPIQTLKTGLYGTKNTLDLALEKNARYLFTSTSEVYGDPEISPQPETYEGNVSPVGKRSQYDQSKRGGETLIKLYFEKYNMDARIVRIFNTYGPGMNIDDGRVITNFIKQVLEDTPLTIYGDGMQSRSFAYVSDTVAGILQVLFSDAISKYSTIQDRVFNVGNPDEFTIVELAEKVDYLSKKYLHKSAQINYIEQPDPYDPRQRCPDIVKINHQTGFAPIMRLNEGLEETFLSFLKN